MKKTFFVFIVFAFVSVAARAQQAEYAKVYAESVRSSEGIVKNAPFSAEAVNESIQTLGDGNRIIRRTSSRLFRDSEGRYRREDMPKQLGLPGTVIDIPESIFILDPVAGFRYTFNVKEKTVRKTPFRGAFEYRLSEETLSRLKAELDRAKTYAAQIGKEPTSTDQNSSQSAAEAKRLAERAALDAQRAKVLTLRQAELENVIRLRGESGVTLAMPFAVSSKYETKTDSLGTQNVEGVEAEGTRSTTTIPAGAIGNERPIEVVYERWYSKDLQMIIMSKHVDPRVGEQTYRLTNVRRDEPSPTLFSPPSDYRVVENGPQARALTVVKATGATVKVVPSAVYVTPVKPVQVTTPKPATAPTPKDQ